MFSKVIIASLLGLSALVAGQDNAGPDAPTPSGMVKVHAVRVGNADGELVFEPEVIRAEVGDLVQFQFYPRNHSVAQSSFDSPCSPISSGASNSTGFFSGFMPVEASSLMQPLFTIPVKDSNPIWFYCATGRHCQGGMAGVINPPDNAERTLENYKAAAKDVSQTTYPGQPQGGEVDEDDVDEDETPDSDGETPGTEENTSAAVGVRASFIGLFVAAGVSALFF